MQKYIFVLICPHSKKVKHVGSTTNPINRYANYKSDTRESALGGWFKSFKGQSLPELKIIETVTSKKAEFERLDYWKAFYSKGHLLVEKVNKDKHINIVVTEDEFAFIKKEIDSDFDGNISNFVRSKILRDYVSK